MSHADERLATRRLRPPFGAYNKRTIRQATYAGFPTLLLWADDDHMHPMEIAEEALAPAALDLLISTCRLNQLIAHRHGDLTATVQPGMRLADLNAALRREKQWLPVDSAFDAATVGGLVATNDYSSWGIKKGKVIGGAVGAIIGAIAGGGKGAAIGAILVPGTAAAHTLTERCRTVR